MNWPVLLNGLKDFLLVVVLGYVLKLMHQQNELLKADKSLKESEISLHKAKIGHLRSLRAPGLAPDLEQIADKYAEKKRQVEEKVKALDGESEPGAAAQVKAFTHYKLGYAHANVEAIRLLEKSAQMAWIVGVSEIEVQINDGIRRLIGETRTALGSAGNPPSVAEWWKKAKQEETRSDPEPDPDF